MSGYYCCREPDWVDDDVDGACYCRSCGKTEYEAEREVERERTDRIFWQEVEREAADGNVVTVWSHKRP